MAYSPAECAADTLRCAAAGAASVHWHARDPGTGAQVPADGADQAEELAAYIEDLRHRHTPKTKQLKLLAEAGC